MDTRDSASAGQVTGSAAEIYQEFFVPALFGQWPEQVLDVAGVGVGDAVLDVGCGTGILAIAAVDRVGANGSVHGVDPNAGMLAVARATGAAVTWHEGLAESLPLGDASVDHVVSQFALMFFADPQQAMTEMVRVTRPGGTVTIATWVDAAESPGYAALIELLGRLFGADAANALRAPFTAGTPEALIAAFTPALSEVQVTRHDGVARFPSLEGWMHTDIRGWTLDDAIDDEQFAELLDAARTELAPFVADDGSVEFAAPALIGHADRA